MDTTNKVLIRGDMQEHQRWQEDVSPCLTASMGIGGGHVPMIMGKSETIKPKTTDVAASLCAGDGTNRTFNQAYNYIMIKTATKEGCEEARPGDGINLSFPDSETRRGRVQSSSSSTLQCNDQQGVVTENLKIRKLTPKECFRLQGWTDDYFDKAAFVNSDSQLYKQAGNGVTVNVIYEIARLFE